MTQWTFYAWSYRENLLSFVCITFFSSLLHFQCSTCNDLCWNMISAFIWFVTIWNRLHERGSAANDDLIVYIQWLFSRKWELHCDLHMNDKCAELIPAELTLRLHKFFCCFHRVLLSSTCDESQKHVKINKKKHNTFKLQCEMQTADR